MQNNLVMFCLEEKKSILETKSDVEEFFHHLVGGDVSIKDTIPLGRGSPPDRKIWPPKFDISRQTDKFN